MVRTPRYKLIREPRGAGGYELYDLSNDPLEMRNLAADPAHAALVKQLAAEMEAWQNDSPPVPVIAGVAPAPTGESPVATGKNKRKARK